MAVRRWNRVSANYYLETADDDRRPVQVDQVPNDIMAFEAKRSIARTCEILTSPTGAIDRRQVLYCLDVPRLGAGGT